MDLQRWRRRTRDEDGTVIVIVAGCLVMFLVLLAFTIDLSAGRQQEQQAQSAADAGALAGAEAIRNGTVGAPVTAAASTEANTNMPGAYVGVTTSPTNQDVTVTVSSASPTGFGNAAGVSTDHVLATAVASPSYTQATGTEQTIGTIPTTGSTTMVGVTSTTSTTPSPNTAIYAGDTSCDGGLSIGGSLLSTGILKGPASNVKIPGSTVISNGDLLVSANSFPSTNSAFIYGGPAGCSFFGPNLPSSSTATPSSTPYALPIPYTSSQFPSCANNLPDVSIGLLGLSATVTPGIYCSTSPISISLNILGNLTMTGVTLIAPSITIITTLGSIVSWTPANGANNLLAWGEGSGGVTVYAPLGSNITGLTGVLAAPTGPVNLTAGTLSGSGLIEGNQVHLDVGTMTFTGTGPTATTTVPVTTTATIATVGSTTTTGSTTTPTVITGPSALTG